MLAAQKAVQAAAANSTMYRTAATWYGVPVKDLTHMQFDRFKRIAVAALAGAVSLGDHDALVHLARLSRVLPTQKGKCSPEPSAVDTPASGGTWCARSSRRSRSPSRRSSRSPSRCRRQPIVEKRIDVPGPERIVVKHIHVPIDVASGRVVNADGSLGETLGFRTVQGGKQ